MRRMMKKKVGGWLAGWLGESRGTSSLDPVGNYHWA